MKYTTLYTKTQKDDILNMAYKKIKKFAAKPVKNKLAQQWIKSELERKKRK